MGRVIQKTEPLPSVLCLQLSRNVLPEFAKSALDLNPVDSRQHHVERGQGRTACLAQGRAPKGCREQGSRRDHLPPARAGAPASFPFHLRRPGSSCQLTAFWGLPPSSASAT